MSNHQTGHDAEKQAAAWLETQGFTLLELNWKTRFCEIDIVAKKRSVLYMIEVKSRASSSWGSGIDYITKQKLKQMKFAAELWLASHDWSHDIRLAAVTIDGAQIDYMEILD